jgi:D-alanyl-D-alanine carboxypeptidase
VRRRFRLAALATAAALAGLVGAGPGAAEPLPAADVQAIDQIVAQQMAAQGIPGVTVSVRAPGRGTLLRSYGLADTATGRPLAPRDAYRIASVTKTFTAAAVLRLADEGRLRLSDRLERYVPGIPNGDRITIREVLALRAGIFDYVADPSFLAAYTADPLLPGFNPQDVVAIIRRNAGQARPPGVETVYSNSNYALLGLVIEKVTGQTAERYVNRRVVRPLGLTHTRFPSSPALPTPFSHGYDDSAGALRDATFTSVKVPWTAGAMVSTVPDMTRYASLLADGALLAPRTRRARLRAIPFAGSASPFFVGYGLGITRIGRWIGHDGSIFGYSDFVFHLPSKDATVVVMVNRAGTSNVPATETWFQIARHLYPGSFPAKAAPAPPAPAPPVY